MSLSRSRQHKCSTNIQRQNIKLTYRQIWRYLPPRADFGLQDFYFFYDTWKLLFISASRSFPAALLFFSYFISVTQNFLVQILFHEATKPTSLPVVSDVINRELKGWISFSSCWPENGLESKAWIAKFRYQHLNIMFISCLHFTFLIFVPKHFEVLKSKNCILHLWSCWQNVRWEKEEMVNWWCYRIADYAQTVLTKAASSWTPHATKHTPDATSGNRQWCFTS